MNGGLTGNFHEESTWTNMLTEVYNTHPSGEPQFFHALLSFSGRKVIYISSARPNRFLPALSALNKGVAIILWQIKLHCTQCCTFK